jgi:hypothetical protein
VAAGQFGLCNVYAACALITRLPCITIVLPFSTVALPFHPLDLWHHPWLWQQVSMVGALFGLLVRLSLVLHVHHCPALPDWCSALSPPGPLAPSLVVAGREFGWRPVCPACAPTTRPPCITIVLPFLTLAPPIHPMDLSRRPWLWQQVSLVGVLFGLLARLALVLHA